MQLGHLMPVVRATTTPIGPSITPTKKNPTPLLPLLLAMAAEIAPKMARRATISTGTPPRWRWEMDPAGLAGQTPIGAGPVRFTTQERAGSPAYSPILGELPLGKGTAGYCIRAGDPTSSRILRCETDAHTIRNPTRLDKSTLCLTFPIVCPCGR